MTQPSLAVIGERGKSGGSIVAIDECRADISWLVCTPTPAAQSPLDPSEDQYSLAHPNKQMLARGKSRAGIDQHAETRHVAHGGRTRWTAGVEPGQSGSN